MLHAGFIDPFIFFTTFLGTYIYNTHVLQVGKLFRNVLGINFFSDVLVYNFDNYHGGKFSQSYDLMVVVASYLMIGL